MRIGIMGGTFNPVHNGHLAIARAAAEQLGLDRVLFIPTGNPNFKQGQRLASAHDRVRMVELAIESDPRFQIDTREVDRGGITYTIDTLRELREAYPDASLYFIVGTDSAATLPSWKRADEIVRLCTIAVAKRPGYASWDVNDPGADGLIEYNVEVIDAPQIDVSSSSVRERIVCGESVQGLVSQDVLKYIDEQNLYRDRPCD